MQTDVLLKIPAVDMEAAANQAHRYGQQMAWLDWLSQENKDNHNPVRFESHCDVANAWAAFRKQFTHLQQQVLKAAFHAGYMEASPLYPEYEVAS